MMNANHLLEVRDLKVNFHLQDGVITAVDGVTFSINKGEIVGLAGESGCGKTVTTQALLRLVPVPGVIEEGEILLNGRNLMSLNSEQIRDVRGNQISIVTQNALAALNPVISVGEQVADVYRDHKRIKMKEAMQKAVEMMRQMGLSLPEARSRQYAHEFSGGMQQRVVIAAALMCNPVLIIADEPTTALDVTIQMQILALLKHAQMEFGSSILYISHDLATVSRICERVMIMYAGEIVESASTVELFGNPLHPYTQGLLASIPPLEGEPEKYLKAIEGQPPGPFEKLNGCKFAPRCPYVTEECRDARPKLFNVGERTVRCILYQVKKYGNVN